MTRKAWDALPEATKNSLITTIEVAAAALNAGVLPDESVPPVRQPAKPYLGPPRQPPIAALREKMQG